VRSAQQVREVNLLGLVVEDRRFHRTLEEIVRVAGEELVERVLARNVEREPPASSSGAAPHLTQAGDRAREGHDERGIECPDIDAEFERVGCDDRRELAGAQPSLDLPPLRRRVAGPVGGDGVGELPGAEALQLRRDEPREQLDALARAHEADRPGALADQSRQQLGRLAERGAANSERRVDQRGVPDRDPPPRRRRGVAVDQGELLEPRQALGKLERVGDRRRREQDARLGPVRGRDSPQASNHIRDMGAEDPAVHVRLIDHDNGEVGEEIAPGAVIGQDPDVQHVGIRENQIRAAANLRTGLARGVTVVDRRSHPVPQPERVERSCLVLCERLRRIEVERSRLGIA
jgi:hypothetical protein